MVISSVCFAQNETTIDGRTYLVHTVKPKETLFGLSRLYNVSVEEIQKSNPNIDIELKIDQKVYIPKEEEIQKPHHVVKAGETLFSIAKEYDMDVEDLKKMNGMEDNTIDIGMKLIISPKKLSVTLPEDKAREVGIHIVKPGETLYSISKMHDITPEQIMELNNLESSELAIDQKLRVKKPVKAAPEVAEEPIAEIDEIETDNTEIIPVEIDEKAGENKEEVKEPLDIDSTVLTEEPDPEQNDLKPLETDKFVEKVEKGVAELIPDTGDTRKYLALHRSIPVNTIIRVRNEINGKEIWARVVGKLPDTGENKDILIKISQAAYDKLGALDKKFRVVITYIP